LNADMDNTIHVPRSTDHALGLYIHIPFCKKKCSYCDFHSFEGKIELAPKYIDALLFELDYYVQNYRLEFETLFIGGGTPTMLPAAEMKKLFSGIYSMAPRAKLKEITIEANPDTVDLEKAAIIADNVTRVSFGAQSFSDCELKHIGRVHDREKIFSAVELVKKAGVKNFNIDLMYGLPQQKAADALDNIKEAIQLGASHISYYMLTMYEDTPLFTAHKKNRVQLPPEIDLEEMYLQGAALLEQSGFAQYEISNFCKSGSECLHNINYWKMGEYAGLGSSASSFFQGLRYTNFIDPEEYIEKIEKKMDPAELSEDATGENYLKEYIMLALRMTAGINLNEFREKFGFDFEERYSIIMKTYEGKGLIKKEENSVFLTRKGMLVSNEIIGLFF
jgi:oxygen-independent coproporphyrinogen III oxidase